MPPKLPPPSSIASQQSLELEALTSILGPDLRLTPTAHKTAWGAAAPQAQLHQFDIILRPDSEEEAVRKHVAVKLGVKWPKSYPYVPPILKIPTEADADTTPTGKEGEGDAITKGVSRIHLRALTERLEARVRSLPAGQEMIWELVTDAQSFLSSHNALVNLPPGVSGSDYPSASLGEQMRRRAEVEEEERRQAQERIRGEVERDERQREERLAKAIMEEERRKKEELRDIKAKAALPTSSPFVQQQQQQQHAQPDALTQARHHHQPPPPPLPPPSDAASAHHMRIERFLDPILLADGGTAHYVRVGPVVQCDAIRTCYAADVIPHTTPPLTDAGSTSSRSETTYLLEQYTISTPHYASVAGKKQLEEVEWELERLRNVRHDALLNVLAASMTRSSQSNFATDGNGSRDSSPHSSAPAGWRILILTPFASTSALGPTLHSLLTHTSALPWKRARYLLLSLFEAIEALHASALLHRNVGAGCVYTCATSAVDAPRVVLAGASYQARLSDMHAVHPFVEGAGNGPAGNSVAEQLVPKAWRAPELYVADATTGSAQKTPTTIYSRSKDVWDVGRLLCQLLFGLNCFRTYDSPEALLQALLPPSSGETRHAEQQQLLVSPDVAHFIASLLQRTARRRPTAKAALETLRALIAFEDRAEAEASTSLSKTLPRSLIPPSSQSQFQTQPMSLSRTATLRRAMGAAGKDAEQMLSLNPPRPGSFWHLSSHASTSSPVAVASAAAAVTQFSRYATDFEEISFLGKGAFGSVVKARNKLDGRFYAIKKIRLGDQPENDERTLREVTALSRLNHAHVVRYVTCWIEQETVMPDDAQQTDTATGTGTGMTCSTTSFSGVGYRSRSESKNRLQSQGPDQSSFNLNFEADLDADFLSVSQGAFSKSTSSYPDIKFAAGDDDDEEEDDDDSGSDDDRHPQRQRQGSAQDIWSDAGGASTGSLSTSTDAPQPRTKRTLLIQMEYIGGATLRETIDRGLSVDEAWRLFRQMLEALAHINSSMGIIHRDLKPSNVLMSGDADIKIGDFGLATTDVSKTHDDSMDDENGVGDEARVDDKTDADLTSDVGTNLYIAPEVVRRAGRYDAKVDMYSLGVIFFEMLASQRAYKTGMERVVLLRELRTEQVKLPAAWPFDEQAPQTKIVRMLLTHHTAERPTPMQLLKSDLLPPKMEDEYIEECIRLMSNRSSTYHDQLLDALFQSSAADDMRVRDHTFEMGATERDSDRAMIAAVCDHLKVVFQRHGAVALQAPPLVPPNEFYDALATERKLVRLLDRSGRLVYLPFDGLLPFARSFRDSSDRRFKRYDIAHVFRDNPIAGGQPRSVMEANFDIVSPDRTFAQEAEIMRLMQEVAHEIPSSQSWIIQLSHTDILDLLLERIPAEHRSAVCAIFAPTLSLQLTPSMLSRQREQLLELRIARSVMDELEAANLSGPLQSVLPKLERLLPLEHRKVLSRALEELRAILEAAQRFGVTMAIEFTPLLATNRAYFAGGALFQFVRLGKKRLDVFAAGGRYDFLMKRFANPTSSSSNSLPHAVGVQIAVSKLALNLARYQELQVPHLMSKPVEDERSYGWWTPRRCDVYVISTTASPGSLDARMELCRELWSHAIAADLMYESMTSLSFEQLFATCKAEGVLFIVAVRPRAPGYKVRDVLRRTEHEIGSGKGELVYWLQEQLARQKVIDQQQLGSQQLLHAGQSTRQIAIGPGAADATGVMDVAGGAAASAPGASDALGDTSRVSCQVLLPPQKYPGTDKYGKGDRNRKQSRHSKQVIIEKAMREAQRGAEEPVPILAVDYSIDECLRLSIAISADRLGGGGGETHFRSHLDSFHNPNEREYAKIVRQAVATAFARAPAGASVGAGRVMLYSMRDERSVFMQ